MAANSKYACSCGRTFSFESVLMRHCKQTGHEPATGPVEEQPRPVMASVQAAADAAKQQAAAAPAPAPPAPEPPPAPAPAPAPPPPAAAPAPPPPEPEPAPAPPPPPPPKPAPKAAAPPPTPPPAAPPPTPAAPPPAAAPPAETAPAAEEAGAEVSAEGAAPGEEPLIYEAALRVLMAKQSAWQDAAPPPPPLKVRLAQLFRPQLETLDSALNKGSTAVNQGRSRAAPYLSVMLAIPIGLVLIWAGYRLAKAMLTLP